MPSGDRLEDSRQVAGLAGSSPRGILYPARLPTFDRLPAPDAVDHFVRWFWIPEWQIQPGRSSRQHIIGFPACNLVVEPRGVGLAGPTTRASYRDLTGTGWAVGALLRPAAVAHFTTDPGALRDAYEPVALAVLHERVRRAMGQHIDRGTRHRRAVDAYAGWLAETFPSPTDEALLANALVDLIDRDPAITTVEQVAVRLGVSARSVQRLARRYVGLPPSMMIRRRRLQEAAARVREDPDTTLGVVAAELGFSDHAHLTNEFRSVLGFSPGTYRRRVRSESAPS